MNTKKGPKYEWLPEEHMAFCTLTDKTTGREFVGTAYCHDDDLDMCNEYTGYEIALRRAIIEVYKTLRDTALIELKALKQLYYSMSTSKKFDEKSYETKMLNRQIKIKEYDWNFWRASLAQQRDELRDYIKNKEKTYEQIRSKREQGQD